MRAEELRRRFRDYRVRRMECAACVEHWEAGTAAASPAIAEFDALAPLDRDAVALRALSLEVRGAHHAGGFTRRVPVEYGAQGKPIVPRRGHQLVRGRILENIHSRKVCPDEFEARYSMETDWSEVVRCGRPASDRLRNHFSVREL